MEWVGGIDLGRWRAATVDRSIPEAGVLARCALTLRIPRGVKIPTPINLADEIILG
jgi:hypothetical protein